MPRGPLFNEEYRPQFTGHQTFPLRHGWLKKVFDAVEATEADDENKSVFLNDDAIARFGVGKNMVSSMRHWATVAGVIEELPGSNRIATTDFGQKIFGRRGLDPYMEHPATLWLVHWNLAARPAKTTWFWVFNHYSSSTFDRDHLVKGILRVAKDRGWKRASEATIKGDVVCFARTYAAPTPSGQDDNDGALESPLTELGLIKLIGKREGFRLVRGAKATLGDGVFLYALLDFWERNFPGAATLSFEAIVHEPGSPGRVFLLDENDVADRLAGLEGLTAGDLRWSETAGLKQVVRGPRFDFGSASDHIGLDFEGVTRKKVA